MLREKNNPAKHHVKWKVNRIIII